LLTGLLACAWLAAPVAFAAANGDRLPAQATGSGEDAGSVADAKEEGLPLEPRRSIRFDSHQATWMSVDLPPDGRISVRSIRV